MSFNTILNDQSLKTKSHLSLTATKKTIESLIKNNNYQLKDLPTLLSPAAENYIEILAQKSHELTKQRFGKNVKDQSILSEDIILNDEDTQ